MTLQDIFRQSGYKEEDFVKGLAAEGVASEDELRRIFASGDKSAILRLIQPHAQRCMGFSGLAAQAKAMLGFK